MPQPTNIQGSKNSVWDELNQKFVFEEISYSKQLDLAADAETHSEILDIQNNAAAQLQLVAHTGDISDLVVSIFHSMDGVNFVDSGTNATGESISAILVDSARFIKGVVLTPAADPDSTFDLILTGK